METYADACSEQVWLMSVATLLVMLPLAPFTLFHWYLISGDLTTGEAMKMVETRLDARLGSSRIGKKKHSERKGWGRTKDGAEKRMLTYADIC